MSPKSLINRLLVTIDKKYNDIFNDILIDTSIRPGHYATVTGRVVAVPELLDNDPFRKHIPQVVRVGDEIAFSYQVVFDESYTDNADRVFNDEPMISPYLSSWSNRIGERIIVLYEMNNKFQCGHYDPEGNPVFEGRFGLKDKENWLGTFTFKETNDITHNNLLIIDEKPYWAVDYSQVYAIKREGETVMVGGYVMVDPIGDISIEDTYDTKLILHNAPRKKVELAGRGRVIEIGAPQTNQKPLPIKRSDIVVFDKRYAEQYLLWGKEVVMIKQERIRAKVREGLEAVA